MCSPIRYDAVWCPAGRSIRFQGHWCSRSERGWRGTSPRATAARSYCRWSMGHLRTTRLVEEFDNVLDLDGAASPAQAGLELEQAAWVSGGDNLGAGGQGVVQLTLLKAAGFCRIGDVVDAGAAAAQRAFCHLA